MDPRPEFAPTAAFERMLGWEVDEVHFVSYNVMVWFNHTAAFLNVAGRFRHTPATGESYTYDAQAEDQTSSLARLLRRKIVAIESRPYELDLRFDNGDVLTVLYDDWSDSESCSWWIVERDSPGGKQVWGMWADNGLRYGEPIQTAGPLVIYPPMSRGTK